MNSLVVLNIFYPLLMISSISLDWRFYNRNCTLPLFEGYLFTMLKVNIVKPLHKFLFKTVHKYISNGLNNIFLKSRVIYEWTPPYSLDWNDIMECFNQSMNTIACLMTIAALDFPCLWPQCVNMAACLTTWLPYKYLPSSSRLFASFHSKRRTISHLKLFGIKCDVHLWEIDHSSGSKHLYSARKVIVVGYTASSIVY
jgi:hypothetical protein